MVFTSSSIGRCDCRFQGRTGDIVKAFKEIKTAKQRDIDMQGNVETTFHAICLQFSRVAAHLLVEPATPKTAKIQMYRNNL